MNLHAHSVALDAIRALRPIVLAVARHDRGLAQQMREAASSVVLNLGEAQRSDPGNARARLHTAAGSAQETRSALQLACAWGYVEPSSVEPADELLDRVAAMLYRLTHPRS